MWALAQVMVTWSFKFVWDGQKDSVEFSRGAAGCGRKGSGLCSPRVKCWCHGGGWFQDRPLQTPSNLHPTPTPHKLELWGASDPIHLHLLGLRGVVVIINTTLLWFIGVVSSNFSYLKNPLLAFYNLCNSTHWIYRRVVCRSDEAVAPWL